MSALILQWFQPAPLLDLEWIGPTGNLMPIFSRVLTPVMAAIIGPPGIAGEAQAITAQEALGGHRVVTANGFHCTPANAHQAIGISSNAALIGFQAVFVSSGPMTEGSWSWTPNQPIFIGAVGVLTQIPPSTGIIRRVAWAITATLINVDFLPPITQA